jgi:hypothetical protein
MASLANRKTCKRCRLRRFLVVGQAHCSTCREILRRIADGRCCAILRHGPGHQSHDFCEQPMVGHATHRGRRLHTIARFGQYDQSAEWFGARKSTGYFDEPPHVLES